MLDDWQHAGFGLYVHWPFCQAKCPYCDFNSHVSSGIDQQLWLDAFQRELTRLSQEVSGRVLNSVYFGGGTPSLMHAETVAGIIEKTREYWPFANDIEITLEANPTSVEAERFQGYRDAGVNRVSIGVQALNDKDLKLLGRLHSRDEALAALEVARSVFPRVSFDLIYARQHQTEADWEEELSTAISLGPDHLSLYQLTIEDGTVFAARHQRGRLPGLPNEDREIAMYEITQDICGRAGLPAYEVSNHAAPGQESKHNIIYWQSGDYMGIGPGAHGRLSLGGNRYATETALSPDTWLSAALAGNGESERFQLKETDHLWEMLLMGLRMKTGILMDRLETFPEYSVIYSNINNLSKDGFLMVEGGILRVTEKGRPLLNTILSTLVA